MQPIRTVKNGFLSLFQSMVDDLVHRRSQESATDDATPAAQPTDHEHRRPTVKHPLIHAATAFVEHLHEKGEAPDDPPEEVTETHGHKIAHTAWDCIKIAYDFVVARVEGKTIQAAKLEDDLRFSECDPGWLEVIFEYLKKFGLFGQRGEIPYIHYQDLGDFVFEALEPGATVALVGDWGTGTKDADVILAEVAKHNPAAVIHLGDIYYSGTEKETERNFLDPMNQILGRPDSGTLVYTLSGNHDMYDAGDGFYKLLPKLNPFAPEAAQPASYFSLRSRDGAWQFLCMDTGLNDHDPSKVATGMTFLEPEEVTWHRDKIETFAASGGKTILLSHHQLFSAFSKIGDAEKPAGFEAFNTHLWESFGDLIEAGKVTAWFWGHEHNLDIYQPYHGLEFGRCIGHGALPMSDAEAPYNVIDGLPDPPPLVTHPDTGEPVMLSLDPHDVYRHGYVILKIGDGTNGIATGEIDAAYYEGIDPRRPIYREVLR